MVVVYVEEAGELTQQALAFARFLAEPLHGFAAGEALEVGGVETLHVAEGEAFASYAPAAIAAALAELAERLSPSAVIAAGTQRGNEVLAHLSARLDLPFAANCVAATPGDLFAVTRVRWGGSLLEDARLDGGLKLLTVQPHSVAPEEASATTAPVERFTPELDDADLLVRVVERVPAAAGGVSLAEAKVVISAGRGVGSPEGFAIVEELAGLLGIVGKAGVLGYLLIGALPKPEA